MSAYNTYNKVKGSTVKEAKSGDGQKRPLRLVLVIFAALLLLFVMFRMISNSQFRLVRVTPARTLPTSTDTITLEFNKDLKPIEDQPEDYITMDPVLPYTATIINKVVVIQLLNRLPNGTDFAISINDIADSGDSTVNNTVRYAVKYIPFGSLSAAERERQTQNEGRPVDAHPLLSKLPHDAISYRIEYREDPTTFGTADSWQAEKDNFIVTINTFALQDGVAPEVYAEKTRTIRARALQWIADQGVNPETEINIALIPSDTDLSGEDEFTGDGAEPDFENDFTGTDNNQNNDRPTEESILWPEEI